MSDNVWEEGDRCYLGGLHDSGQYVILHIHGDKVWVMNRANGDNFLHDRDDVYFSAEEAFRRA